MAGLPLVRCRSSGGLTNSAGALVELLSSGTLLGPLTTLDCSVQPDPSSHSASRTATRMLARMTVEDGQEAWQTTPREWLPSSHTVLNSKVVLLVGPYCVPGPRMIRPASPAHLLPHEEVMRL